MNSKLKKLTLLLALCLVCCCNAAQARTVRLFVIGNSFSGNALKYLPQIAKAEGDELVVKHASLGGHSLQQHWSYVEANDADANDPKGKPYAGKSLREMLSSGTWDFVSIQQYSLQSSNAESYRPYAQKLRDFIRQLQPQTEIVMHQTWAYRRDSKDFGIVEGGKRAQSQREMWQQSRAAYTTIAKELGVRLMPVGDAFWTASNDPQWGFKSDTTFDEKTAVEPVLPNQTNSLNVGYVWKDGKLNFDSHHANEAGCYLAGLVWYGFLFGTSPEKVTFVPQGVDAPFAAYLRGVAAVTLKANQSVAP